MISLLFPFKDDGTRLAQFELLQKRWAHFMPEAEIIVSDDDGGTPFSKTIAVNNCYKKSSGNILAMVDADVWLNPKVIRESAKMIESGKASWVQPCNQVYRLNKEYTQKVLNRNYYDVLPPLKPAVDCERITKVIGLIAMFSRKDFEAVGGMDPRFRGWGWEDNCFNQLMNYHSGPSYKGKSVVYHLWHPRQKNDQNKPIWEGQTDRNAVIGKEYKTAYKNSIESDKLMLKVKGLSGI
jgi:predicted glycosyltransferase involved in capsule biosynthesis